MAGRNRGASPVLPRWSCISIPKLPGTGPEETVTSSHQDSFIGDLHTNTDEQAQQITFHLDQFPLIDEQAHVDSLNLSGAVIGAHTQLNGQ